MVSLVGDIEQPDPFRHPVEVGHEMKCARADAQTYSKGCLEDAKSPTVQHGEIRKGSTTLEHDYAHGKGHVI